MREDMLSFPRKIEQWQVEALHKLSAAIRQQETETLWQQ
jgi:hypothetical protein